MTDHFAFLEDCVKATEECVTTVQHALRKIEPGSNDLPRLTKILKNQHHFLLLPSPLLQQYKSELATDLGPRVEALVKRAEGLIGVRGASDGIGEGGDWQGAEVGIGGMRERKKVLEERLALLQAQAAQSHSNPPPARLPPSSRHPSLATASPTTAPALDPSDPTLTIAQKRKMAMLKGKRDRLERELGRM